MAQSWLMGRRGTSSARITGPEGSPSSRPWLSDAGVRRGEDGVMVVEESCELLSRLTDADLRVRCGRPEESVS